MHFFQNIFHNVYKWWNVHVVEKVFRINNNRKPGEHMEIEEETEELQDVDLEEYADAEDSGGSMHMDKSDAMEILNRINREKQEAHRQEIEEGRERYAKSHGKSASGSEDEDARLAEILASTKVNITPFIEEGMEHRVEAKGASASETETDEEADCANNSGASEEQLQRAQEILDRLNREAAEDEAKKQAEIEAAKAAYHV